MSNATKTYLDKPSLWVVIITALIIIGIVTTGVISRFLLEEYASRILLISLIVILSIIGLAALTYLEVRKRKMQAESTNMAKNGYLYKNIQPTAPRDPDWEYSNRATVEA
ncbi:unnamed protein product [Ceutorhynchus assimilis]|uniref:Uncharacterized protein n=1 Tax=Ceutorhynchus assimilis TaxID=467358 RepID=A0A9P0DU60_9CUCU|nr:unnamed protein product [Ceutorhynchus assimilis]